MGFIAASGGHQPPDVTLVEQLLDDLEYAARRCQQLTTSERMHHPSTMPQLIVAIDDIADTAARLNELLP